jgi:uncharacterized protein
MVKLRNNLLVGLLAAFMVVLMVVVPLLTPIYWGEEFGWNGYLVQRIFPDRPIGSVVATGLIWAVWHFPLAFLETSAPIIVALLVRTIWSLLQEVIHAWLRRRSGSVWTASLFHAGNNFILVLLTYELLEGGGVDGDLVTILILVVLSAIAAWIILGRRLSDPANREALQHN